jgi:hypothetical protein
LRPSLTLIALRPSRAKRAKRSDFTAQALFAAQPLLALRPSGAGRSFRPGETTGALRPNFSLRARHAHELTQRPHVSANGIGQTTKLLLQLRAGLRHDQLPACCS